MLDSLCASRTTCNRLIVIVNSGFLERPQKRIRWNQLIHGRLTKTKSIGSGQDQESQAGRQTVRRLWWMVLGVETGGRYGPMHGEDYESG